MPKLAAVLAVLAVIGLTTAAPTIATADRFHSWTPPQGPSVFS